MSGIFGILTLRDDDYTLVCALGAVTSSFTLSDDAEVGAGMGLCVGVDIWVEIIMGAGIGIVIGTVAEVGTGAGVGVEVSTREGDDVALLIICAN